MKTLPRLISLALCLIMILSCVIAGTVSAEEQLYTDVKPKRWSYEDIKYVTEKGLMNGTGDGKFSPAETMTRAMVVTVFYRLQGEPDVHYRETFTDVKNNKWYSNAVTWAAENGIVNGVGGGKFAPMETVTREQLATILMRYATTQYIITDDTADITGYADYGRISNFAKDAMAWANAVGLITGVTSKTLEPRGGATREQFAAILHRFNELIESNSFDFEDVYNAPKLISTYTEKEYPPVTDADFYVAIDGDDTNPGTLDKPFATFERAVLAVRELKKTKTSGTIKVAFKAGNYGNLNITLTAEDAGTAECPITYCAYGDGDVIFSNGVEVKLDEFVPLEESDKYLFMKNKCDDIYKADLSDKITIGEYSMSSMLYGSGKPLVPARFPSTDYMVGISYTTSSKTLSVIPLFANRFKNYHTYEDILCVGHLGNEYLGHAVNVESYNPETCEVTLTQTPFQYNNEKPVCYFSNISEELDMKGEFWIDRDNKVLYVYKPDDDYTLSTVDSFMHLDGADYISFVGLDFKYCTADAIKINANNVTIDQAEIIGVGADLDTYKYINNGNGGTYAVHINGYNVSVKNSELAYLEGGGIIVYGGDCDNLIPSGNLIDNNYIHDYERTYETYKPGVRLMNSVGAVVSHNEICNATHAAIIFGQAEEDRTGRAIDNIVEYNYIHDVVIFADSAAIYGGRTFADRGNIFRYNYIANVGDAGWAVYLDDGLSGQTLHGNIFYEAGQFTVLHSGGRDNIVTDNVTIGRSGIATLRIGAKYADSFANGTTLITWESYYNSYKLIPAEGTAGRAKWEARWPELFAMTADLSLSADRLTDRNFVANTAGCVFRNNLSFFQKDLEEHEIESEYSLMYNTFENNPIYRWEEAPDNIFVNPARGNYCIREDSPIKLDIPFSEIGRY